MRRSLHRLGVTLVATLVAPGLILLGLGLAATGAAAQGLGISNTGNQPLEVFADEGIEWRQNESIYVARGNARAVQGNVTVYADTLTAHYRKGQTGSSEIWKLEAVGNVRIASPTETAYGDKAVYTVDDAVLVMTGQNLRLVTPRETITARDRLEYWDKKNLAVARGDAIAVTEDRRIRADTLTATFKPNSDGKPNGTRPAANSAQVASKPPASPAAAKPNAPSDARAGGTPDNSRLERMDAVGNVVITTAEEVVRGNRGVYFQDSGIATLTGSVKITRGQNQLNGEAAEVNLRTGISRLVNTKPGTGGPVRALIMPQRQEQEPSAATPNSATPAPAQPDSTRSGRTPSANPTNGRGDAPRPRN